MIYCIYKMRFKLENEGHGDYKVVSTEDPDQIYRVRYYTEERDLLEVLEIEEESFENPWTEEDFYCLRQRNCIGIVSELDSKVSGFIIYELHKSRLHLLNFAVHPGYRRYGAGTATVEVLKEKLMEMKKKEIITTVRESNLTAQLFFKSQGFRAITVLRDYYEDTGEDGYFMKYNIKIPNEFVPVNRITQYLERAA